MNASDGRISAKMSVKLFRFLFFKLLLFQIAAVWCGAKHVAFDVNRLENRLSDVKDSVMEEVEHIMHTGVYSRHNLDRREVEVTVPVRVARDGALLSRALAAEHAAPRSRRYADHAQTVHDDEATLHYNLTVQGMQLRLDLRPSEHFLTPQLVVERHGREGRSRAPAAAAACHYRGAVRGQPASSVALSACDGISADSLSKLHDWGTENKLCFAPQKSGAVLFKGRLAREPSVVTVGAEIDVRDQAGLLRTQHGEFWIEPSAPYSAERHASGHPHVVYRRSAVREGHARRRRRRDRNCATREPPRPPLHLRWLEGPNKLRIQQKKYGGRKNRRARRRHRGGSRSRYSGLGRRANTARQRARARPARSVSKPRHVEVLLVADQSMTEFHGPHNVETYLLTIMNMVSSLYLDPTIGNFINVVVVKIILLEDAYTEPPLNVSTNADTTLGVFCKWQQRLNPPDDAHPHHHDVAILITRLDICAKQDTPCSTLGVAQVAGMCLPDRSCSVNEDNGITLAHTITHELGHNFGLYHDTEKIGCHRREGSTLHIMTPIFEVDTVEVAWSRCSRRDVTNFLDSGMGECLGDQPVELDYTYPDLPAGALYDAARQCRMQFGMGVDEVCTELSEICEHLWCVVNGTCKTMLRPAAPGTSCGEGMWCQNHTCVMQSRPPPPQHGGWGEWSDWASCSRSCGAGVSTQMRDCVNPMPRFGGNFCTGERTRYRVCNTDPCPKNEPSYRDIQCSKFDNTVFENKTIPKWIPYFDQDEPCELYCTMPDQSAIVPFGEFAADGTACNMGTRDMCISGICRRIGCDWIVDSNATEDACGICNGDGSACKTVLGIYSKGSTKESGYSEVAVIPAGSRNVKVEEIANSKNYIGIGSANSHKFYLNGKKKITLAGEYLVAGSPALYERDRDWEKVKIPGPIKEDIKVYQMIYRGKHRNPGVRYQYTVDRKPQKTFHYRWKTADWSPCTKTCGGGIMRQQIVCIEENKGVVDEEYCISDPDLEKPLDLMQQCNMMPCPTHWWVGVWSGCQENCIKEGYNPMKRRNVLCVDKNNSRVLPEKECDAKAKPVTHIPCIGLTACEITKLH